MDRVEERLSGMLFDYKSTTRTDYQKYEYVKPVPVEKHYISVDKPKRAMHREYKYPEQYPSYVNTMTRWKNCLAPFNLYIQPDPIHGFDPRVGQLPYEPIGDPDREKVQKTRPRLVMTPAASLDDIEDPETRALVIDDMYVSTVTAAQRPTAEAAFPSHKNVKAPMADKYAPPRPIDLPKLKPKYVSTEWRMDSVTWDQKQLRGHADATAEFWTRRPLRYRVEREN